MHASTWYLLEQAKAKSKYDAADKDSKDVDHALHIVHGRNIPVTDLCVCVCVCMFVQQCVRICRITRVVALCLLSHCVYMTDR